MSKTANYSNRSTRKKSVACIIDGNPATIVVTLRSGDIQDCHVRIGGKSIRVRNPRDSYAVMRRLAKEVAA